MNASERARTAVKQWLYRRGYLLSRRGPVVDEPFGPFAAEVFGRVEPYTMTPPERVAALIDAVTYIVRHGIRGAFVECGVWRGGSMMAAAITLERLGERDRDLFLFDTFEGMTMPTEVDVEVTGTPQLDEWHRNPGMPGTDVSVEEVRRAMSLTGYDPGRIRFVKGEVEETLPERAPGEVALLRLDTDWYESTRHELETLYPRLVPGGVLVIDDYGHYEGARKAVDEYLADHRILLTPIDYAARIGVKQSD